MKNKHLLLIFFCTLLLGLVAKYAPWFKSEVFKTDLVQVDAADLLRISITQAGQQELFLERSDEGWVASQDDFAAGTADSVMAPILAALARVRSIRIVHTTRRDTLLLLPSQAIHVEMLLKNGRKEVFEIGRETVENKQPATFIEIDRHDGIYLADNYLRRVFARSLDDFRNKTLLDLPREQLHSLRIFRPGVDTLYFQKSDTAAWWSNDRNGDILPVEAVETWLQRLDQLNGLPFASHFDESLAGDHLVAGIVFGMANEEYIQVQFFATRPGSKPSRRSETLAGHQPAPAFVVQSSRNALNFFALSDTLLARKIWSGPLIAPD